MEDIEEIAEKARNSYFESLMKEQEHSCAVTAAQKVLDSYPRQPLLLAERDMYECREIYRRKLRNEPYMHLLKGMPRKTFNDYSETELHGRTGFEIRKTAFLQMLLADRHLDPDIPELYPAMKEVQALYGG